MNDTRGSIWRKWDLHIHSPKTRLASNYKGSSIADFCNKVKEQELSAIGLTNYYLFEEDELEEVKKHLEGILVLPNLEFRINDKNKDGEYINIHVIFNPEVDSDTLLDIMNRVVINNIPDENIYLSRANLKEYDESEITVSLDDLKKILSQHLRPVEDYLIGACPTGYGNFRPNNSQRFINLATKIDKMCHFMFGNEGNREFYLNQDPEEARIKLGLSPIPVFKGSDAHKLDDIGSCFTWIKADPTYEGLKQALYEPEARVKIQENNPEKNFTKLRIDSIEISDSEGFPIVNQIVPLNRDLVCVIGGRGSGKSALLETTTFCFGKNKTSDYQDFLSIDGYKPFVEYFEAKGAKAVIGVKYADLDNNIDHFEKVLNQESEDNSNPILYLGQNQIEEIAGDRDKIHSLAFEAVIKNSSLSDEFGQVERSIDELETQFLKLNKEIDGIKVALEKIEIEKVKVEKDRLLKELKLLESKETKEVLDKLQEQRVKRDNLNSVKEGIETIRTLLSQFKDKAEPIAGKINELLPQIEITDSKVDIDLSESEKMLSLVSESIVNSLIPTKYNEALSAAQEKLKGKTEVSVTYIESLKSQLSDVDKSMLKHQSETEKLKKLREERFSVLQKTEEENQKYLELYQRAIKEFEDKNLEILNSIKLEANVTFSWKEIVQELFDLVDKRKVRSLEKFVEDFLNIKNFNEINFMDWLKTFEADSVNLDIFYEDGKRKFEEIVFRNHHALNTLISYEVENEIHKPLRLLSLGQKGTVLLKLFLSIGNNCPIIIDQPEDHLDNDFIYSDLVETIRKAKAKRQIIVVTHDANLVVNGDADQVIIAEYKDESISHTIMGGLENPNVRSKVAKILEGGDEAFKKRERKYQFR